MSTAPLRPAGPTLATVLLLLVGYSALHVTARMIASTNLAEVDPEIEIQAQRLALGYVRGEAGLYTWIVWALERLLGPGLPAFQLLKYASLTACCGFIYLVARRVMAGDRMWALLAVEALALVYQLSWRLHEGFSSELLAFACVPATVLAVMLVAERGRPRDFAVLGLAAGLALLTVTPARLYLLALAIAVLAQPALRARVLRPGLVLAVAVAAVLAAPLVAWLAVGGLPGAEGGRSAGLAARVVEVVLSGPVEFLSPLILIVPVFFWRLVPGLAHLRLVPAADAAPDWEMLLLHATLAGFALLAAAGLSGLIRSYAVQWIGPLFLMTTTWAMARARRAARGGWDVRLFVGLALALAVFAFGLRLANMYVQQPVCKICRWGVPYDRLAAELRDAGFGQGSVLAADADLGGNLRRFFPESAIAAAAGEVAAPPALGHPLLAIWPGEGPAPRVLAERAELAGADLSGARTARVPWRARLFRPDGRDLSSWRFIILK